MNSMNRSLDLSSLDDIPEDRPYSKGDELTRLDSGLGEWDSSSSRKTSVSSQGSNRLSPEINDKHNKEPKRRRSGIDMVMRKPSLMAGPNDQHPKVVTTRLPRIPRSNRSSGVWSRKISPAGLEFLKMDDEMAEVMRNGVMVLVPRKISDHIPTVPIHSTDRFVANEWNENLGLDDDDLQIYKTPHSDIYQLHKHKWEFFGKIDFRKMMITAMDGNAWMSGQEKFEIMKTMVSDKEKRKMEKMLKMGYTHDDVVNHFMEEAERKSGNNDLKKQMEQAIKENQEMSEDDMIEVMKNQMGEDSVKEMEKLIAQGHAVKDVMKKMMNVGNTKEEELLEKAETINHLLKTKKKNIKVSEKEAEDIIDNRFDDESKEKVKDMMKSGLSVKDAIKSVIKESKPKENLTEIEKKVKLMSDGQEMSQYQIYELIKEQLDEESRTKMEEMVKNGCPLDEAIEYFMKKGKTAEQVQNEKSEKLRDMLEGQEEMSQESMLEIIKNELGKQDQAQVEKMLASGCSMQEVIDHFLNRGKEEEKEQEVKTDFQEKMEQMMEGKALNDDEMLAMMRGQLDDAGKDQIKEMLAKGYSKKDIINHLMRNTKTVDEKQRELTEKLRNMFDDQDISEDEKQTMLEKQLSSAEKVQMEEMLKNGCSLEEVIGHFMNRSMSPNGEKTAFAMDIENMMQGKEMSEDGVLKLIADNLDKESLEKMSEMLSKGYSKQDVINHFLKNAKTKEEQMNETAEKIKALISDESMTDKDKLEILRNQLSKEDVAQMEMLLKDGGSVDDVMNQILKSRSTESVTECELSKVVNHLIAGKSVSKSEILNIIRGHIDDEAKKEMEIMIKNGLSEQEVIDYFMSNGKTIKEKRKEISCKIKALISDVHCSPKEKYELIKNELQPSDINQIEKMLSCGCSMEEVLSHFCERGMHDESGSDLCCRVKKLSGGRPLSPEQMVELIKGQLGKEEQKQLDSMLAKGYNAQDIVEHFMDEEKSQNLGSVSNLNNLIDTSKMTKEEARDILKKHMNEEENILMDAMLREGKSMDEIICKLSGTSKKDTEETLVEKIKKLSRGKSLSDDELLELVKENVSNEDKALVEEMLKQGKSMAEIIRKLSDTTKPVMEETLSQKIKKLSAGRQLSEDELMKLVQDNITSDEKDLMNEMLKQGKSMEDIIIKLSSSTKQVNEETLAQKIKKLSEGRQLSEDELLELVKSNISVEEKTMMEEMLKDGKSMEDIIRKLSDTSKPNKEETLSEKIKKLSEDKNLSTDELLELIKNSVSEEQRSQISSMLSSGKSPEDIVKYFLENEICEHHSHVHIAKRLDLLIDLDLMDDDEIKDILEAQLSPTDKKEMNFMLENGCSMEEVVAYFKSRGIEIDDAATELSKRIKKLSSGKTISETDMLNIIREQLGEEGKAKLESMIVNGLSSQEIIEYFMTNGKTEREEYKEVSQRLGVMIQKRKLSKDEVKDILESQLGEADKAKMTEMLTNGCSYEEVLQHFLLRGSSPERAKTELARRVRKMSKGKGLTKSEIIDIIRLQLTDESKQALDQMIVKGYYKDDVITHFMIKGKTCDEEFREIGEKLSKIIDIENMTEEQIIDLIRENVGPYDKVQIEEMIRCGCSTPEILKLFLNRGKSLDSKTELYSRVQKIVEGKIIHPLDLLDIIKENASDDLLEEISKLLEKGYTVQDVIEHALKHGKTQEEKLKEVAEKMQHFLEANMSEQDILDMMRKQLGKAGNDKIEEMLKKGYSLTEILESILERPSSPREDDTEFAKKVKQMMGDRRLEADEMIDLIKSLLDVHTQLQIEEMLRNGCSKDEVIQHFMNRERNKRGQKKNEFGRKIFEITKGTKLSKGEIILLMKNHLDAESCVKLEDMIKKCYPMEDIIDYFLKNGKTPEQALREKALLKEQIKKESSKKIRKMIDGNNLSNEEILAILKLQMGDEDKLQLEAMLKKGCSAQEIIEHFMHRDVSDEETEQTLFEKKISDLTEGKDLSNDDILKIMKSELDDESINQMEAMLSKGYTQDDVIKYFMKHGDERNDFVQEMKKLTGTSNLTKDEILETMKNKLGVLSQRKIDDMVREGHSVDDIIKHLMTHGKTQEQETHLFKRRMSNILEEKPLTEKEKVAKLKENLGKEAASMVEELMKKGLTANHIMDLFLKHGNNLNSLVLDNFFIKEMKFPDELHDAENYENRDVFYMISKEASKNQLPFMSPSGKVHIFGLFFEKVLALIDGIDLTHREILDLMRSRMGAGYAKEFDELRDKGLTLQQIVDYFLQRDGETVAESRLVAKLKADARVDKRVYLKRTYSKEKWGVSLTYTFSKNAGLHLILNDVVAGGPAWESGVRPGDVIVTVNDWLIVLMDRPQVAAHLFQAGANIVKLGIQKTRGAGTDRYLGLY